jgi:hypothetical protein
LQASYEGHGSQEGYSGPVLQGEQKHDVKSDLSTAKSTLKEARTTITHTVTVSSESGHAHEETSASGLLPIARGSSTRQTTCSERADAI